MSYWFTITITILNLNLNSTLNRNIWQTKTVTVFHNNLWVVAGICIFRFIKIMVIYFWPRTDEDEVEVKYEDSLLKLKNQMDLRGRAIQYLLESLSYQLLRFDFFDRLSLRFIRMEMEMDINWIVLCLDIKILCLCFFISSSDSENMFF